MIAGTVRVVTLKISAACSVAVLEVLRACCTVHICEIGYALSNLSPCAKLWFEKPLQVLMVRRASTVTTRVA